MVLDQTINLADTRPGKLQKTQDRTGQRAKQPSNPFSVASSAPHQSLVKIIQQALNPEHYQPSTMKAKLALLLALASTSAFAGTPISETITTPPTSAPSPSDWWLTITPYGWVTATEGDMGVAGQIAPVDISMRDTLEDLEMSFMLAAEGGFDRWAFGIDGIFGAFSSGGQLPPGTGFTNATVDFDQFFARVHAGYQVIKEDHATLTAFVGARFSYLSMEIAVSGPTVETERRDDSKSWIDPVVGMHGSWEINDCWFIQGGGDIGGFGVSSDLIWQATVALGYHFTDSVAGLIGYRGMGVDYSDGGFLVDTIAHGPALGLSIRF